jgi:hypothetical protein
MSFPKTLWVIEDWSTTTRDDLDIRPFLAPECRTVSIQGRCPNRPGFEHAILTSPIVRVEGRRVFTQTGSRYVLGKPAKSFVEFCRANGHHVPTHKHPLKLITLNVKVRRPRDSKGRFLKIKKPA